MANDRPVGPDVSVVLPIYNEEESIGELHRRLSAVLSERGLSFELIFVNDGSSDRSWQRILELTTADARCCGVNLTRNFGHQLAITAGVELSRGRTVVVMDSDLQDPPELIPALYEMVQAGSLPNVGGNGFISLLLPEDVLLRNQPDGEFLRHRR